MAEPDVELDVSDLDVCAELTDDVTIVALVCQPDDARKLADRLCATLGYWPLEPGSPGAIRVE